MLAVPSFEAGQARLQLVDVGHHHTDGAPQHLGVALGQVELLRPDVDPHVGGAEVDVGIAGEAESAHVEQRGELLVGHRDVDVLERQQVADVLVLKLPLRLEGAICSDVSRARP